MEPRVTQGVPDLRGTPPGPTISDAGYTFRNGLWMVRAVELGREVLCRSSARHLTLGKNGGGDFTFDT